MGVIRGSEQTLDTEAGYLDQKAYKELSTRTQSTFPRQREQIYRLFEAYLKRKRELRADDPADRFASSLFSAFFQRTELLPGLHRTHALLKGMQEGYEPKVDFLYVDEAQDNLLIDARLLRSLCHNPRGMFWAGDTAQTISTGSSFRFDDLKAVLYRIEVCSCPVVFYVRELSGHSRYRKRTQLLKQAPDHQFIRTRSSLP